MQLKKTQKIVHDLKLKRRNRFTDVVETKRNKNEKAAISDFTKLESCLQLFNGFQRSAYSLVNEL
jgi:hypothetical protein